MQTSSKDLPVLPELCIGECKDACDNVVQFV